MNHPVWTFQGQDTVGAAVVFCLYHLAKHQEIQSKAHQEIIDILIDEDVIGIDQLKRLVYLEQCIKETLRMVPSIPLIARVLTSDVKLGIGTLQKVTASQTDVYLKVATRFPAEPTFSCLLLRLTVCHGTSPTP